MAFFEEASSIITTAISNLSKMDQKYLRYIAYNYDNPLSSDYPDVNGASLINSKITPYIKIPDAKTEAETFVNVFVRDSIPFSTNSGFRKMILNVNVITHESLQLTKSPSKVRLLEICSGIDKLFNDQKIVGMGEKKIFFEKMQAVYASDKFVGYQLAYRLEVNSNVSCGG